MIAFVTISLVIHLCYYVFVFWRLAWWQSPPGQREDREVSILVCVKNEVDKVSDLVKALVDQDASDIVIVDDLSDDGTYELLLDSVKDHPQVKVLRSTEDRPGKKLAVSVGRAACSHQRILYTDADCEPASPSWSRMMAAHDREIVLGYSPMRPTLSLVNLFSRYETYMTGVQYLSYAIMGQPYMGVGRNMLIDRSLMEYASTEIRGQHLASGDDDLTVNALATASNTTISIDPEAQVYTTSVEHWSSFVRQKIRHISTASYYKPLHKVLLSGFSLSQIIFYSGLIVGVVTGMISPLLALAMYILKQVVQLSVHIPIIKKLKETIGLHQLLFLDLLLYVYYVIMPFMILFHKKNNHWN